MKDYNEMLKPALRLMTDEQLDTLAQSGFKVIDYRLPPSGMILVVATERGHALVHPDGRFEALSAEVAIPF